MFSLIILLLSSEESQLHELLQGLSYNLLQIKSIFKKL